jgi:hypothetical protein
VGDRDYHVRATIGCTITFRQFYFPGWQVTLNGAAAEIYSEPAAGLLTVRLPAGEHFVELSYVGTSAQAVGEFVSLLSLIVCLSLIALSVRKPQHTGMVNNTSGDEQYFSARTALLWAGGITLLAVIIGIWVAPQTTLFRLQSPSNVPAHMQTRVDADFGGVFTLLGYTLHNTNAYPNGTIEIELYWRAQRPIDTEYRPIVQIIDQAVTIAYAVSQPVTLGGGSTLGYPIDRFASELHRLKLFALAPPSDALVSIQLVNALTGEALLLPDGRDRLTLATLIRING